MLQTIYDSAWHLPAITFLAITLLFLTMTRKLPFIVGFSIVFGWFIAADAWGNGALSPVPMHLRQVYMLLFVVLGDWRYLMLVERYSLGSLTPGRWLRSFGIALIMPALSGLVMNRVSDRVMFIVFELGFLVIASIILLVVLPRRHSDEAGTSFAKSASRFEILQYSLWAGADLLMLAGFPWAMILRICANILYYSLFVPFVWWKAPDSPGRQKSILSVAGIGIAALALSFMAVRGSATPATQAVDIEDASLAFVDDGKTVASVSLAAMVQSLPAEEVRGFDPYYQHEKKWKAITIESVIKKGYGREASSMLDQDFVIRAVDGFTAYFPGGRLLEGGAYLAFQDLASTGWEPIGPQKADPGPFYLVWSKPTQQDLETHPRPWQIASIETVIFETQFPHVRPEGVAAGSPPERGFQLFRVQCLPCHAVNRSGGKVGPELNVPRNILEYREAGVVRAFIKNPLSFRYTIMPAHPMMTEAELDDIIAYFNVMKTQKRDEKAPEKTAVN